MITEFPSAAPEGIAEQCVVVAPNRSLNWRQTVWFFVSISILSLGIAIAFAAQGLWLILPFAGLELLALGVCLYLVLDAGECREVVSVTPKSVRVEKGRVRRAGGCGGPKRQMAFSRHWVRVECIRTGEDRLRIWVSESGRRIEIGEFLADKEKRALAEQLCRMIATRV